MKKTYKRIGLLQKAACALTVLVLGLSLCPAVWAQTHSGRPGTVLYQDQIAWSDIASVAAPVSAGKSAQPTELLGAGGSGSSMSPAPSAGFEAIEDNGEATIPNIQGASGPNHLLAVSNTRVLVQDRAGEVLGSMGLDTFWSGLGSLDTIDPALVYDPFSQRFILVSVAGVLTNQDPVVLIAVSQSNDPTGSWHRFMIDVDQSEPVYGRAPTVGFNKKWVAVQFNMFDRNTDFLNSHDVFVFPKTNLYAGNGAFTRFELGDLGDVQNRPVPAVTFDNVVDSLYFVGNWLNDDEGLGYLRVFSLDGPVNAPVFNYGEFVGENQFIPAWSDIAPDDDDFAPQLGSNERIYLNDARIQNVVYRRGTLWTTHTVFYPADDPSYSAIQWFETTPGGNIFQRGTLENPDNGTMYGYPSIAVNRNNDVLLAYSVFAPFFYAHPNYAFRQDADFFGRLRGETFFRAGDAPYYRPNEGLNLWGERSATVVDGANDTEFWSIQPYPAQPDVTLGEDRWGTWWGRVSPPANIGFVSSSDAPDPIIAGGALTYNFSLINRDPRVVSGMRVTYPLPPGVSFVSGSAGTGGSCGVVSNSVVCEFALIPDRGTASGSITVRPTQSGTLSGTLILSHNGPDPDPSDNSVTRTTTINPSADMAVLVTDSPDPARVNQDLTYNIVATNLGPSSATAVFVTNTLPASVTFVSAVSSQGTCSRTGTRVICNLGSIAAQNAASIAVIVRAPSTGFITNRTDVKSAVPDSNTANNTRFTDTRVASPPTITALANQVINEDNPFGPLNFTVGDAETPASQLAVVASSSNPALLPEGNLILGGSGSTRNIRGTPLLNQFGVTTISVRVTDLDGLSASNSFVLTVNSQNDLPTISAIPNLTIDEDTQAGPFTVTVGDVETPAANLVLTAVSSNPTLLPVNRIQVTGSGASRMVTMSPATNQFGTVQITLTVSDGTASANSIFTLTVTSVNDRPTLSVIPDQTINEDQPTPILPLVVGDVESPLESLLIAADSSDLTLFVPTGLEVGGSGANRTVLFRPVTNAFGSATIRVRVTDAQGASSTNSFLLTVNPVNDPPTLDVIPNMTINENSGEQVLTLTGISAGPPNEPGTLTFQVLSDNPSLIPLPTVSYSASATTATLRFTSAPNRSGSAMIRVIVRDSQPTNNVLLRPFTVTVLDVNDPPFMSHIPDQILLEDTASELLPFTLSDVETPVEQLILFVASSNTVLIPDHAVELSGTGSNRTVRVTPSRNAFGQSEIALIAFDGTDYGFRVFLVTVTPVNDDPTIALIQQSVTLLEDTDSGPIQFLVQDAETPVQNLMPTFESSNLDLLPHNRITLSGTGPLRTLRLSPSPDQSGEATITLRVQDGDGGQVSAVLQVTVQAANDLPTLDSISDLMLDEDGPQQLLMLTGITSGAPNEQQGLAVSALSSNPALTGPLTVQYQSPATTGMLRFQTLPDAFGTAVVSVVVQETGPAPNQFERTFTVRVRNLNDPPRITPIDDIVLDEDQQSQPIGFILSDPETPADQLTVTPFSSNEALIPLSRIQIAGQGEQRFIILRPAQNQFGSTSIALTVSDGDGASEFIFFEVRVTSVNDMPTVSTIPNLSLNTERPSASVVFTLTDDDTPVEELTVAVESSNPSLLPPGSLQTSGQGAARTLVVTPAQGASGTARVTLSVVDLLGGRTDRTFGVSYFDGPILHISQVDSNVLLSWSTNFPHHVPGQRNGMAASEWNPVGVPRITQGTRYQVVVPQQPNQGFFQLVELPPPTITSLAAQTILEDTAGLPMAFSVSGVTNQNSGLAVQGSSDNEDLLPAANIVFAGAGTDWTFTLTPAPDRFGNALVTISVVDGLGRLASSTFQLTVTPVNDRPSFVLGSDRTVLEDSGPQVVPGWATGVSAGAQESSQTLTFLVSSDNPGLFSSGPLVGVDGTLTYTPAADANGSAIVRVRLRDDGGTDNGGQDTTVEQSFRITVTPVNDPPTFVVGPNQTILEDAGPKTVNGWTALFRPGPANEISQVLSVQVVSDNQALFTVAPSLAVTGTLTYTPAPDAFGTATVTVTVLDSGGTAEGGMDTATGQFTITIQPVNDRPTLDPINDLTLDEDAEQQVLVLTGISTGAANESDALSFSVVSDNPDLVPNPVIDAPAGSPATLTFTPAAEASGTVLLTITVDDNQPTNNTVVRSFTVTVNPVNDAPTLDPIADVMVTDLNEPIEVELTGIGTGAPNENQTLMVTATSGNTSVLPDPQVVYSSGAGSGRLVLQPSDVVGSAIVTVTVTDNGGTAFGGINSVVRTFTVFNLMEVELEIQVIDDTTILLSWPTLPPGFVLESRSALTPEAGWAPVAEQPTEVNGRFTLTLPIEGLRFFRLVR